jgi:hypothetical protein
MKVQNAKEVLTLILMKEKLSITQLAKKLSEITEKKVYQQTLSSKLIKGTLKFNEMVTICELLGYEIAFNKK